MNTIKIKNVQQLAEILSTEYKLKVYMYKQYSTLAILMEKLDYKVVRNALGAIFKDTKFNLIWDGMNQSEVIISNRGRAFITREFFVRILKENSSDGQYIVGTKNFVHV